MSKPDSKQNSVVSKNNLITSSCTKWMSTGKIGKVVIGFHLLVIILLLILTGINYGKFRDASTFIGSVLGVLIGGYIGYCHIYALYCCGGLSGKVILIPTVLFEILIIIAFIMFFYTEATNKIDMHVDEVY